MSRQPPSRKDGSLYETSSDELVKRCRSDGSYRQEYVEELKRRGWAESHPDDDYDPEDER